MIVSHSLKKFVPLGLSSWRGSLLLWISRAEPQVLFFFYRLTDTDLSHHNLPAPVSFLLTELEGNPKIYTYYAQYDILASFNVMLARAEDPQNDILFTGDDHNTEGFLAWKRLLD